MHPRTLQVTDVSRRQDGAVLDGIQSCFIAGTAGQPFG